MSDHQIRPKYLSFEDSYEHLRISLNPDGSIFRDPALFPTTPAAPDPSLPIPVLSKDLPINHSKGTWARVFLPRQALDSSSSSSAGKLPIIVYFHGGGFILYSAASPVFHDFSTNLAAELRAVVVSIEYRLAPEHRLPAAYDDAVEAFHWVKTTGEVWLKEHADYANCFLMGSSAGGNVAYHAALRLAETVHDFEPLKIKGLILHGPFFGGTQKTETELTLLNDPIVPPGVSDLMWSLSLPIPVDCDHEYCNPTVGGGAKWLDEIQSMGWRALMAVFHGDPLSGRQIEVVKLMEKKGIKVEKYYVDGGYHGVEIMEPSKAIPLFAALKSFLKSTMAF
uniref:Carboxylesterase 1-like n=1 Tax=Rhizophora mucronata TaxID=61149 RepID=A0A2P2NHM4_RHIMU